MKIPRDQEIKRQRDREIKKSRLTGFLKSWTAVPVLNDT